jgi:hypothetical protein
MKRHKSNQRRDGRHMASWERVPVKRTLCEIPALCRLRAQLIRVELWAGSGHHYGDRSLEEGAVDRRWPACVSIFILLIISLERKWSFLAWTESLLSRQLTYSILAKVDGHFSLLYPIDFCLPPSYHQIVLLSLTFMTWDRARFKLYRYICLSLKSILRSHCSDLLK